MKIRVWIIIRDNGDGSSSARLFPSEESLRAYYNLDEDDFAPGWDVPMQIDSDVIETFNCEVVE